MTDSERLVDTVAEALREAGLPRRADAPEAGGYGVRSPYERRRPGSGHGRGPAKWPSSRASVRYPFQG
jgi:hypothetical protein